MLVNIIRVGYKEENVFCGICVIPGHVYFLKSNNKHLYAAKARCSRLYGIYEMTNDKPSCDGIGTYGEIPVNEISILIGGCGTQVSPEG